MNEKIKISINVKQSKNMINYKMIEENVVMLVYWIIGWQNEMFV